LEREGLEPRAWNQLLEPTLGTRRRDQEKDQENRTCCWFKSSQTVKEEV
jgi:hypothetical protein